MKFISSIFILMLVGVAAVSINAQVDASNNPLNPREDPRAVETKSIQDMLAKQRLERDKKDHEALLKRGEEALKLSQQLESDFEKDPQVSADTRVKLANLEKVVVKIRKELGGSDDDKTEALVDAKDPSTLQEAFKFLQKTTVTLVDELKRSTRFTVSAVAIESSNALLRAARFLRLRK